MTTTYGRENMIKKMRPLAALAIIAVLGAGCSSSPADSDGSDGGGNQALKFSQCMRDNGIRDFPDPNASGELTIDQIANGSSLDTTSAAFEQAMSACKDLQPAGFTGEKRTKTEQQGALAFAKCMRENGVADFPDPEPDAPLVNTNLIPSTKGSGGMDALHAAMGHCEDEAGDAGVTGP